MMTSLNELTDEHKTVKEIKKYGELFTAGLTKGIEDILKEREWQMKKGEEMKVNEKIKVETKYMGEQEINEVALFTEAHKGSGTIWYKLEGRIGMNRYLIDLFRDKSEAMKAHRAILQKLLAAQTKEAKILLEK